MTRFKLTIEYDGRPYVGWQRQDNGPTVQATIEAALTAITGQPAPVHGSGRTDAGVHARGQVAHVDIERSITPPRLVGAINAHLRPAPIAVIDAVIVPDDFHARFDCVERTYRYRIVNRRSPLTFDNGLAWRVVQPLDADAMHEAAQSLVGRHDFTTFRAVKCQANSPIRTLDRIAVARHGDEVIVDTAARSFLHHQVRSMVGCLKLVGDGSWPAARLREALQAADRAALGLNAPPDGLTFMAARYPPLSDDLTNA